MAQRPGINATHQTANLSRLERFWLVAGSLSLLLFFSVKLNHAIYFVPSIDDAWMATVAKNLANGYGWSSSFGRIFPFDGDITTGPSVLLPLAAAIKLFGNLTWLPRVFSLLWNCGLLAVFLCVIRPLLSRIHFLRLLVVLPLLLSCSNWHLWLGSLGDIPAFLYLAIGSACLARSTLSTSHARTGATLAGLSFGLATLAKLVAIIPAACTLVVFFILFRQQWRNLAMALPLFLLPQLAWYLYQTLSISTLPLELQQLIAAKSRYIFLSTGSGIDRLLLAWKHQQLMTHLWNNSLSNLNFYQNVTDNLLRPIPYFFYVFCVFVVGLFITCTACILRPARHTPYAIRIIKNNACCWLSQPQPSPTWAGQLFLVPPTWGVFLL